MGFAVLFTARTSSCYWPVIKCVAHSPLGCQVCANSRLSKTRNLWSVVGTAFKCELSSLDLLIMSILCCVFSCINDCLTCGQQLKISLLRVALGFTCPSKVPVDPTVHRERGLNECMTLRALIHWAEHSNSWLFSRRNSFYLYDHNHVTCCYASPTWPRQPELWN